MTTDISGCDYYFNDEFPPSDDTAPTAREWQLRFRDLIERARCSGMTHDQRQRVVRYVREFITIMLSSPSEYPELFEDVGYDVGDELDAEIAERSDRYYSQLFPRVFSPGV